MSPADNEVMALLNFGSGGKDLAAELEAFGKRMRCWECSRPALWVVALSDHGWWNAPLCGAHYDRHNSPDGGRPYLEYVYAWRDDASSPWVVRTD